MPASIPLGPYAVPSALLILLAAAGLGLAIATRWGRRLAIDVEPLTWRLLAAAVVASRLAFVWPYRDAYLESPLDLLDIRDGGWDAQAGIIVAWIYALALIARRPVLRKPLLAGLATASVVWLAGSVALTFGPGRQATLSAVAVPTSEGLTASLSGFRGKPTVVNLWATWCPPCQREMPVLQRAQAEHPEVHFVFLNQGESAAKVQGFMAARSLALRNVLLDLKGQAGAEFSRGALPTTLFFDAQGRLVDSHLGELSRGTLAGRLATLGIRPGPAP